MSTIIELSPEQAQTLEDIDFERDDSKFALTPLAQG